MMTGLYVVTAAVEACGKSMEIISPEEEQGGVYEDGVLALQAILRGVEKEATCDRFLYEACFEDRSLRLERMIFGLGYDRKANRYKLYTEPKQEKERKTV